MLTDKRTRFAIIAGVVMLAVIAVIIAGTQENNTDNTATPSVATLSDATYSDAFPALTPEEVLDIIAQPSWKEDADAYTGFWKTDDGTMFLRSGKPMTNVFLYLDDRTYKIDKNGYLVHGWYVNDDYDLFYFNDDGASITGWIQDQGNWYYLENRQQLTGWQYLAWNGQDYSWYYFDDDGIMLEDCETPDGYYVAKGGSLEIDDESYVVKSYDGEGFTWNKDTTGGLSPISGLEIAGMPAEFYMLSIAGETSGMANSAALINGDRGRAYGACQFDYRYDLVPFMKYAYEKHPDLWPAFSKYINYSSGNSALVYNTEIGQAFLDAMNADYETCIADQLEFVRMRYWDSFATQMDNAGFDLDNRHIAVSAALLSVNVNCGAQANIFINNMSTGLSDEEMIRRIYELRNTVFANQNVGSVKKGTNTRYRKSEPQMALDLLYGYVTIDSNVNYGGGVEWHGNPFTSVVSTAALPDRVYYDNQYYDYDTAGSGRSYGSRSQNDDSDNFYNWEYDYGYNYYDDGSGDYSYTNRRNADNEDTEEDSDEETVYVVNNGVVEKQTADSETKGIISDEETGPGVTDEVYYVGETQSQIYVVGSSKTEDTDETQHETIPETQPEETEPQETSPVYDATGGSSSNVTQSEDVQYEQPDGEDHERVYVSENVEYDDGVYYVGGHSSE